MANKYLDAVTAATKAGFSDVTIINKSFQVVGASSQTAVASAWVAKEDVYDDKTGEVKGTKDVNINENQELANEWKPNGTFHFYKKAFKIIKHDGKTIGCKAKKGYGDFALVAGKYDDAYYVMMGKVKPTGNMLAKKAKKSKKGGGKLFADMKAAYNKAYSAVFEDLDEDD